MCLPVCCGHACGLSEYPGYVDEPVLQVFLYDPCLAGLEACGCSSLCRLRLNWSGFPGKRTVHVGEGESNTKAKALATEGLNPSQGCGLSTLELSWNTNPHPSPALREANNSENSCFLIN